MNKRGFTLIEVIAVGMLIVIVAGLFASVFIPLIRTSAQNQAKSEASFIGGTLRDYIKDQLIFASDIILSNSVIEDDTVTGYSVMVPDATDGTLNVNGATLNGKGFYFGKRVSYTITATTSTTISMTLLIVSNGVTEFSDSFFINNINMGMSGELITPIASSVTDYYIYYK